MKCFTPGKILFACIVLLQYTNLSAQLTVTGGNCAAMTANYTTIPMQLEWKKNGIVVHTTLAVYGTPAIVAGGNGQGSDANQFYYPTGVAVDKDGNIYIADRWNHRVQKWAPGATEGVTVAGGNGQGSAANQLDYPFSLCLDKDNNIYAVDLNNYRIQKWAPGATEGVTVAGGNGYGDAANQIGQPFCAAVDDDGNLYISENGSDRVQKWAPGATEGVTVAGGNGNGDALNQLNGPIGVAVDGEGTVYIADAYNNRFIKWATGATEGVLVGGYYPNPFAVAVDKAGNMFAGNTWGGSIERYAAGTVTDPTTIYSIFSSSISVSPWGLTLDTAGNVYAADPFSIAGAVKLAPAGIDNNYTGPALASYHVTATNFDGTSESYDYSPGPLPLTGIAGVTGNTSASADFSVNTVNNYEYMVRYSRQGESNFTAAGPYSGTSFTISSLTAGTSYYCQVQSHCAVTDEYSAWSTAQNFTTGCDGPYSMFVTAVHARSVRLNALLSFTPAAEQVQYKKAGTTKWVSQVAPGYVSSAVLGGLTPSTHYKWQVRTFCAASSSAWVSGPDFTTVSSFTDGTSQGSIDAIAVAGETGIIISPNPVQTSFTIHMHLSDKQENTVMTIYDNLGKKALQENIGAVKGAVTKTVDISGKLSPGIYMVVIQREDERFSERIIVIK